MIAAWVLIVIWVPWTGASSTVAYFQTEKACQAALAAHTNFASRVKAVCLPTA